MELRFFTTQLTSVKYRDEEKQLEFWDKAKIYAAFVFGFLFAGIGSPIAGFATSYYLRSCKIKQLKVAEKAAARAEQAARLKKEALKIRKDMEKLIELRVNQYKLAHLSPMYEKSLAESNPSRHYYKPMQELFPPTARAALCRHAYLYC
jgi:hypothetical protein